jgi:hypothetical protein
MQPLPDLCTSRRIAPPYHVRAQRAVPLSQFPLFFSPVSMHLQAQRRPRFVRSLDATGGAKTGEGEPPEPKEQQRRRDAEAQAATEAKG